MNVSFTPSSLGENAFGMNGSTVTVTELEKDAPLQILQITVYVVVSFGDVANLADQRHRSEYPYLPKYQIGKRPADHCHGTCQPD